jgi:chromosome segregation ATPase
MPLSSIRSNIEQGYKQREMNRNQNENGTTGSNSNTNRSSFKLASSRHDTPSIRSRRNGGSTKTTNHSVTNATHPTITTSTSTAAAPVGSGVITTSAVTTSTTSNNTSTNTSTTTHSTVRRNASSSNHNTNTATYTNEAVNAARETRAEAQMKRLEYAQRKAQQQQQQQGDDWTKKQNTNDNHIPNENDINNVHQENDPKHIIQTFQQQIEKQQQQIDELKFFQELDQSNATSPKEDTPTSKSIPSSSSDIVQQLQHQITFLTTKEEEYKTQIEQLQSKNIELQASLQALDPKTYANQMTSSDAYKKALRLQSDLLDSKNLLQEESLRRERAEMNLDCFKLEADQRMMEYQTKIQELEKEVQERIKDLDDGVNIMKGLEEEVLETKALLEEEEQKNDTLMEQFEEFEKEKEYLAEKLTAQLQENQQYVADMESRFDEEKRVLEDQCAEFQKEVDIMKERVKDMEEKRKVKDEMMEELQDLQDDMEATIKQMQLTEQENEKTIADLEDQLDKMNEQVRRSNEKVSAMEQVVAIYHEKTSTQIQEYIAQVEEAQANEEVAREELQEYLLKLKEAQEEIETLCSEMEVIHEELEKKRNSADDAEQQIASLTESLKSLNSDRAKQHQYMRDKKKWNVMERTLRQELEEVRKDFATYKAEHLALVQERDELNKECFQMDDENKYLKEHVKSLEAKIDKYCSALEENETESSNQIKSLEQELHRVQASTTFSPNTSNRELDELKTSNHRKDQEIEHLKRMLENEKQLVAQWKNGAFSNGNSSSLSQINSVKTQSSSKPLNSQDQVYSPFHGFEEDDDVQPFRSDLNMEWDEMDNHRTVGSPPKKSLISPDTERKERASIENDAVRRYMRQRRKNF